MESEAAVDGEEGLQTKVQQLQTEMEQMAREFGEGRAKLKQLYMQKEEEVRVLGVELEEANSRVVIAECTAENRVEAEQRKCREELATLQQLAREEVQEHYEGELQRLTRYNSKLEAERKKLKHLYHQVKEQSEAPPLTTTAASLLSPGVLSGLTKSIIAKHVPGLSSTSQQAPAGAEAAGMDNPAYSESADTSRTEEQDHDSHIKKPAEDSAVYQELVVPLQEEVRVLRERLRGAEEGDAAGESSLAAEKSSRADLELYSSILNAQKAALADQLATARADTDRWRKLYEGEQQRLRSVRGQRSNDQYLSSKRHSLLTQRLRQVLTAGQLEQLHGLADKEDDDLPDSSSDSEAEAKPPASRGAPVDEEDENILEEIVFPVKGSSRAAEASLKPLQSSSPSSPASPHSKKDSSDLLSQDGGDSLASRFSPENLPRLTEDQRVALLHQDRREDEVVAMLPCAVGGQRVVSEASWRRLQRDLKQTKANLARPCKGCQAAQEQLRAGKAEASSNKAAKALLEAAVERQIAELAREARYRLDMEEQWTGQLEQYQEKESAWSHKLAQCSRLQQEMMGRWRSVVGDLNQKMAALAADRLTCQQHLNKVQHENDQLAGKFLKTARDLQDELIDLPTSVEDMQLLLLRLKEDVITAKVAQEATEGNLGATVALLQTQLQHEEGERRCLQEGLGRENRELRDMVASLQQNATYEQQSGEAQQQQQQQDLHVITTLKREIAEMLKAKRGVEGEVSEQRARVTGLQHDLDLSEETQRDFVRLSQSLQVQLEKIRQSDSEVRWQHEDDVTECGNCKLRFTSLRRKHHCRHCGRVFCSDCVTKSVAAGPNNRQCRVCDVCHTLLVPHATPYFSADK